MDSNKIILAFPIMWNCLLIECGLNENEGRNFHNAEAHGVPLFEDMPDFRLDWDQMQFTALEILAETYKTPKSRRYLYMLKLKQCQSFFPRIEILHN